MFLSILEHISLTYFSNVFLIGGYHFEIDDGRVRWFHRNRLQNPVFSVITDDIIKPDVWTHLIGSYNSTSGEAKVINCIFYSHTSLPATTYDIDHFAKKQGQQRVRFVKII